MTDITKYSSNGQYVLSRLVLFAKESETSDKEIAWDLSASFTECSIFESLDEEFITGYVTVVDSVNLNDLFPLYGEERVEVSFHTSGAEDFTIDYIGSIYKVSERIRLSEHSTIIKISFCSQEMINSQRKYVQSYFSDTNSNIVNNLYNNYIKSEQAKQIIVEDTLGLSEYTFGAVKPAEAINILKRYSISKDFNSGFVFFENQDAFNFVSLQSLYQQEPVAKYTSRLGGIYEDVQQRVQESFETIQSIKFYEENSFLDRINDGIHGSKHTYFDIVKKQIITHEYEKDLFYNKEKSLGSIANKKKMKKGDDVTLLSYTSDKIELTEFDMINRMKHIESKMFSAEISVFGDSKLKAGDVISVYFPRNQADQTSLDNVFDGEVLIFSIRHTFTRDQYVQEIEIVKDAYSDNAQ